MTTPTPSEARAALPVLREARIGDWLEVGPDTVRGSMRKRNDRCGEVVHVSADGVSLDFYGPAPSIEFYEWHELAREALRIAGERR